MDKRLLDELKEMVREKGSLPMGKNLGPRMRKERAEFLKRYPPINRRLSTPFEIESFITRHRLYELMGSIIREFKRRRTKLIVVEGGDATGKSVLVHKIAGMIGGARVESQSGHLFNVLFGLPKSYKSAVIDYSTNRDVAFLYYFVQNIYVLEELLKRSKGKRYALLDSFALRTMASHRSHPSLTSRNSTVSNEGLRVLIDKKLNPRLLNTIRKNKSPLFFVFLETSEGARQRQARERGVSNAFDVNRAYYAQVTDYLKKDQRILRKSGVRAFSMLSVEEGEKADGSGTDAIFIQSRDAAADIRLKAYTIIDALSSNI